MKTTLVDVEEIWRMHLDKAHLPESECRELYDLLQSQIDERKLELAHQMGYDETFLTTTVDTNPFDPDSVEFDYFAMGREEAADELQYD